MSLKVRAFIGVALALAIGSVGGKPYATAAAPYYNSVTRFLARGHPWEIVSVEVAPAQTGSFHVLRLIGTVHPEPNTQLPDATVVERLQVGEVIETVAVFWPMLLLWPAASARQRLVFCLIGIPVFLLLEVATTGVQLIHSLPEASALLRGEVDPVTPWERYSRFLEAGGRFGLEVCAVLLAVGAAKALRLR
jgi:hypothetical protein